jgi:teichuronic acid exporter
MILRRNNLSTLRNQVVGGVAITAVTRYAGVAIQFVITAILARLLTPQDFGLIAIIMVFINFFNLLSQAGLGPAIVQKKDLSDEHLSTLFYTSIIIGVVFSILFILISPWLSAFYNDERLISLGYFLSLSIFFSTTRTIPEAILQKKLNFFKIGIIAISSSLISGVIGIYLAYSGYGVYALVYQNIISSIIHFFAAYFVCNLKLTVVFKKEAVKKVYSYSLNQLGFNFINYFSRNLDNFLIGKYLGSSALGYYDRAYKLMMFPIQYLTFIITPVLHPIFSRYQDNIHIIRNSYLKMLEVMVFISLPMISFLYVLGEDLIVMIFGKQWIVSVPVFKVLCFLSGLQILTSTTGSIFQSLGRTDTLFKTGIMSTASMVTGIVLGLRYGIIGVAVGYSIGYLAIFFPVFIILFKLLKGGFNIFVKNLFSASLIALVIGFILYLLSINIYLFPSILRVAIITGVGLAVYLIIIRIFKKRLFFQIISLPKMFKGKEGIKKLFSIEEE